MYCEWWVDSRLYSSELFRSMSNFKPSKYSWNVYFYETSFQNFHTDRSVQSSSRSSAPTRWSWNGDLRSATAGHLSSVTSSRWPKAPVPEAAAAGRGSRSATCLDEIPSSPWPDWRREAAISSVCLQRTDRAWVAHCSLTASLQAYQLVSVGSFPIFLSLKTCLFLYERQLTLERSRLVIFSVKLQKYMICLSMFALLFNW